MMDVETLRKRKGRICAAALVFVGVAAASIGLPDRKADLFSSSSNADIHRQLFLIPTDFWASMFCVLSFATGCICTEAALRDASGEVELCRGARIEINEVLDISGKTLILTCPNGILTNECVLDGQGSTRIFQGTSATLELDNVDLVDGFRSTSEGDGGAIHLVDSNLVIRDASLRDNEALGGAGGAIFATNSVVNLINCDIRNNVANTAAAIALINSQSSIQDATIEQNSGQEGSSVGINGGSAGFSNVNFFNNVASSTIGAALAVFQADVTVALCTFSGNQAALFPDILVLDDQNPTASGTRVDCVNNVFCNGFGSINEIPSSGGTDLFDNLCNNPGSVGTPGQSPCP